MDLPPRKDFAPPEDTQCHLTGSLEHVEVAHMVPRAAKVWWDNNHMSDVDDMSDDPTIDCDKNVFGLRKEVHKTFDESTVIPFPRRLGTSGSVLLAFVQKRPSKNVAGLGWELIANYQHRRYRDFDWICKEFIFARFAWSKFCTAHFPILDPTNSKLRDRSVYLATRSPFGGVEYREWHISDRNFPRPRPGHGSTSGQKADKKAGGNQDDDREFEDDCVAEEVDEYYKRTRGLSLPSDEESDYSQGGSSTSGVKRRSPSTSDIDIEDEEPRGRPPKRTRQLVGSVATHQVGWARGLSSPSPNSSAAGDVPDLSASCSSYEGSLMSKGSKSSNGTKPSMTSISTDDGKSGMSKATQGRGGTMSVVVSGDSKNTSDTTHYYAHHEPIA
ncbi:hypothetical protein F4776DRAFT_219932 [Hypoxylon sp. NC0597]|nr:hypothetical protein F4776DRAFT_219932 [Hypoxylon sp. NC0597]